MCVCVWMLHYELHNRYNNKMFAPFPLFVFRCFFVCRNCNLSQSCDFRPWYFEQIKLFIVCCNLSYVQFFSKCSSYIERYSASCIFMTQYFDHKLHYTDEIQVKICLFFFSFFSSTKIANFQTVAKSMNEINVGILIVRDLVWFGLCCVVLCKWNCPPQNKIWFYHIQQL